MTTLRNIAFLIICITIYSCSNNCKSEAIAYLMNTVGMDTTNLQDVRVTDSTYACTFDSQEHELCYFIYSNLPNINNGLGLGAVFSVSGVLGDSMEPIDPPSWNFDDPKDVERFKKYLDDRIIYMLSNKQEYIDCGALYF